MKSNLKKTVAPLTAKRNRAFTLTELMFVLVLIAVIGIGLTSFMRDSLRGMLWSVRKAMITNDFRQFTLELGNDAIQADFVFLYRSFTAADYASSDNRIGSPFSGDCLVFVNTSPSPEANSPRFYESIIVYYSDPNDTNDNRSVFRSRVEFEEGSVSAEPEEVDESFETTLAGQRDAIIANAEQVLELASGLEGGRLFSSLSAEGESLTYGRAFLINSEIVYGEDAQQVTNTYNLTISTRSLL